MIDRGVASRLPIILLERSASCYYRMNLSLTVLDSVKFGGPRLTLGRTVFEFAIPLCISRSRSCQVRS